jgi:TPR repeat protein
MAAKRLSRGGRAKRTRPATLRVVPEAAPRSRARGAAASDNKKYLAALQLAGRAKPNHAQVRALLEEALEEGSPHAAWALGTWYLHGTYVEKDHNQAFRLLKRAARYNVPDGHYELAVMYELGEGVPKDMRKAFQHYWAGAAQGDSQSLREVARCYLHGLGVGKDPSAARLLFMLSKRRGAKH